MANGLTLRAERFVEAVLDPTVKGKQAAALKAGYSPASAASQATELLKNPKIIREIAIRQLPRLDRATENANRSLDLQSRALTHLGERLEADPLTAIQGSALIARTSKEVRESFGEAVPQGISARERLQAKRTIVRAALLGALRGERLVDLCRSRLAELDAMISRLS